MAYTDTIKKVEKKFQLDRFFEVYFEDGSSVTMDKEDLKGVTPKEGDKVTMDTYAGGKKLRGLALNGKWLFYKEHITPEDSFFL